MHKGISTQVDPLVEPATQILSYRLLTILNAISTKPQFSISPRNILKELKNLVQIFLTTSTWMNENFKSGTP